MIHQALKLLRTSHSLSQVELAQKLNLSKSHVSEIESGKKQPTWALLQKYSLVFSVPVSSICYLAESLESPDASVTHLKIEAIISLHRLTS